MAAPARAASSTSSARCRSAEPIRYIETGVDNYGNAYFGFDINTPVKLAPGNGELYTRVVGQVQNGGTQTDFTPNNNYFIAPSVTWKPDVDTTLTILALGVV